MVSTTIENTANTTGNTAIETEDIPIRQHKSVTSRQLKQAFERVERRKQQLKKREEAVKLAEQQLKKVEREYRMLIKKEKNEKFKERSYRKKELQTELQKEMQLLKEFPDPNYPKKPPLTGYVLFFKEYLHKTRQSWDNNTRVMRDTAALWRSMSDEEKAPFSDKVATLREEYHRKKAEYEATDSREKWLITAQQLRDSKPSPHGNGFSVFFRDNFNDIHQSTDCKQASAVVKQLGQRWRQLSDEEKSVYRNKAQSDYAQWKAKVAAYYSNDQDS